MKAAGAESYQVLSTGLGFLAVVIHVSLHFRPVQVTEAQRSEGTLPKAHGGAQTPLF